MAITLNLLRLGTRLVGRVHTALIAAGLRECGAGTALLPPLRMGGEQHIAIGSNVYVGSNSWIEVIEAHRARSSAVIEIGDGCSLSGFCTISAVTSVVIESRVLIARYVYIADHGHEFRSPHHAIKDQGITNVAPVRIGSGAWIGQGAVICPGVRIGRNAVVGANSVVRHDVEDYCVVAGAPARVIRRLEAAENRDEDFARMGAAL